jgi:hypothetical protein
MATDPLVFVISEHVLLLLGGGVAHKEMGWGMERAVCDARMRG